MTFEYIVVSESDLKSKRQVKVECKNYLELFNELGKDGWDYCGPYPQGNAFMFKRSLKLVFRPGEGVVKVPL